jgi:hypothetical protein
MNAREKTQAIQQVLDYMRPLTAADFIQYGGEDLHDPRRATNTKTRRP